MRRSPNPPARSPDRPTARELAVRLLGEIEETRAFAETALDRTLSTHGHLTVQDRRLLTHIAYGSLRMQASLDRSIRFFTAERKRPLSRTVRNILRTALYQMRFLDRVPDFAAVHEAVGIARRMEPAAAGLVNAVLRNALRAGDEIPHPDPVKDFTGYLSATQSHPRWLVERWIRRFGRQAAESLCRANNAIPPLTIRSNRLKTDRESLRADLRKAGIEAAPTMYSPDGLILSGIDEPARNLSAFHDGHFQVQDEGSQLVSRYVAPGPGDMILDLCAGAGGKSTHLAEIMGNCGSIVAVDHQPEKIRALTALTERLGVTIVRGVVADATGEPDLSWIHRFDRVLVDVPCSGLGTLRRNPEIKGRCRPGDPAHYARLQRRILEKAASCVRPGGVLVYSTCTLTDEENEGVLAAFLDGARDFRAAAPPPDFPEILCKPDLSMETLPHVHGTDGFFAARLQRRGIPLT